MAAAMAPAAASPISAASRTVRMAAETGRANASISAESGASYCMCRVECSPTMFTTGERALRALCRLESALASPGPRCSSVAAGRPAMRA